jgi:hypothetical protein
VLSCERQRHSALPLADGVELAGPSVHYPTLILADRITLAHLSVKSTLNLPNSAGEPVNEVLA